MPLQPGMQVCVAAARTVATPRPNGLVGWWLHAAGVGRVPGQELLGLQRLLVVLELRPETWIGLGYRAGALHRLQEWESKGKACAVRRAG